MWFKPGSRRGSYAALYALTAGLFIGFGAIAVDISMLRLADAEIQAVADAAAQAGVLELRRTDNQAQASNIATQVITENRVAGITPNADLVDFGLYEGGLFASNNVQANAVRIDVSADMSLPFSSFWGDGVRTVSARATAAARALHTVLVVDITNSWSLANFLNARDGVLAAYDQVTSAASNADRIGCVIFYGKYGVEYMPLMLVTQALATNQRARLEQLRPANLPAECPGGEKCAPQMPTQFPDETGTDHAIGIQMAVKQFAENPDPSVYRAMIVVTDGQPANVGAHTQRIAAGDYSDLLKFPGSRYEFTGIVARTVAQIRTDTVAFAQAAWANAEVNTWFVSFLQDEQFMRDSAQGDGYFIRATNSADLVDIFRDIAESLPIALVE